MQNWKATIESQYGNSPTLLQMIERFNGYIDPATDIDNFFNTIWNVETATGYGLDVWGRIVVVPRVLHIGTVDYFGFQGPSDASGLPWNQAPFYNGEATTMNFALSDDAYRQLIYAKALKNICDGSVFAINNILLLLFGPTSQMPVAGDSYCTDDGNMTMTYTFHGTLSPVQSAIIFQSGVLPQPNGVTITVVHP